MRAYYVKKLLQKSLRTLENLPHEAKAMQDMMEMAEEKHEQSV